jgi:threonylcarbamoyladenosine tRNA methylthiotransferase CDKAL1
MTNPPYIMEHLEKIAYILNHPNVYAFLHIPVQAGANYVLDKMNREYKIEDFEYVCGIN